LKGDKYEVCLTQKTEVKSRYDYTVFKREYNTGTTRQETNQKEGNQIPQAQLKCRVKRSLSIEAIMFNISFYILRDIAFGAKRKK
jgi:hypothetical protein